MDCFRMLLLVALAVIIVHGRLIEIQMEVANIMRHHNNERSNRHLQASDMLEVRWDEELARKAGEYAERCTYSRPNSREYSVGSNLYYEQDFVHDYRSVHRFVETAFKAWTMNKRAFTYSANCGSSCPYVQMISAHTNLVGCAISTCDRLNHGGYQKTYGSLLVCFYSPRTNLQDTVPYRPGRTCTHCPRGTFCRNGLCCGQDTETVPYYLQDWHLQNHTSRRHWDGSVQDGLSASEKHYLMTVHNRLRGERSRDSVKWDNYLERWANWVVSCAADYPGPAHCYTNFERLDQGDNVNNRLIEWSLEGDFVNIQLEHGCRTPNDRARCNHYTNVCQPTLTSMACAAKDCKDSTRQLVCIYDTKRDRDYRGSGYDSRADREYRSSAYDSRADREYRSSTYDNRADREYRNSAYDNRADSEYRNSAYDNRADRENRNSAYDNRDERKNLYSAYGNSRYRGINRKRRSIKH